MTKRRHVAVSPDEVPSILAHLARAMRTAGRTPALAWAERPSKTTTIVYLKPPGPLGEFASLVQFLTRVCEDHGLVPSPSADRRSIVARTPAGARTRMETRLTLGRHAVRGDALVLEYTRWETEEAAREAARAAGAVGLMAAFGAFGVIAVVALNATSAASPIVRYGAPPVRRVPVRRRGRSMMGRPAIWSWRWDFDFNRAGADGVRRGADECRRRRRGNFNVPGSNLAWSARTTHPSAQVSKPGTPPHLLRNRARWPARVRRRAQVPGAVRSGERTEDANNDTSSSFANDGVDDDGWTLVLTPETAWAEAEEAQPSGEPTVGDFNVPSAPPLPREPTPTDADVHDAARDRRRTGETTASDDLNVTASDDWNVTASDRMSRDASDSFALGGANVPKHFSCPITHELFVDPVIFADGHTYERDAIATWLRQRETSPMTGASFPGRRIVLLPNHAMRSRWRSGRRSGSTSAATGGESVSRKVSAAARDDSDVNGGAKARDVDVSS